MSLRTSAWLLPQKVHIVRLEARAMSRGLSRAVPFLEPYVGFGASTSRPSGGVTVYFVSFRHLTTSSTEPVILCFLRGHIIIAIGVILDELFGLAGVMASSLMRRFLSLNMYST